MAHHINVHSLVLHEGRPMTVALLLNAFESLLYSHETSSGDVQLLVDENATRAVIAMLEHAAEVMADGEWRPTEREAA